MRKTSRTSLIAVLAAALFLPIGLISSGAIAAPVRSDGSGNPARARAEALLDAVTAAVHPAASASRRAASAPDLTMLFRDLRAALPALSTEDRHTARSILARPQDPGGDKFCLQCPTFVLNGTIATAESTHFLIHYQTDPPFLGENQVSTPQQVANTISVLEHVYAREVTGMGYRKPLSDASEPSFGTASNPTSKIDVFLVNLSKHGYYGYVSSDSDGATEAPYVVLDNDYTGFPTSPLDSLKVTVAHEFFHGIQFAYDALDSTWFLEGSAVWMEDQVYPTINDYLQYLNQSQITQSQVPIDTAGDFERYGAVIFWKYLSEGYHSVDLIRRIWDAAAVSRGSRNGIQATIAVLKYEHISFAQAFARFSVWNTLPSGSYADRKLFPHPVSTGTFKLGNTTRDTGTRSVSLDHLASANVALIPSPALPTKSRLTISVDAPGEHVAQVRVQVRKTNGSTVYVTFTLNSSGNGSHSIYFSGQTISSVRVTMANVTVTGNNRKFSFRARVTLP